MSDKEQSSNSQGFMGFIQNLISSLFSNIDPEREKKKLLKDTKKELKKFSKYFKAKDDSAQPALAKFFYDIYVNVGPAQMILERYVESNVLKQDFVEHFMGPEEKKLVEMLTEDAIRKRAQKTPLKLLKEEIKEQIVKIYSLFNIDKVKQINALYTSFLSFYDFISFDFHFLLKKFDSALPDKDFVYNPNFDSISAEYLVDDFKDFLVVAHGLKLETDWETLLGILQKFKEMELVPKAAWKKNLQALQSMLKSRLLQYFVILGDQDPYYKVTVERHSTEIVETYLSKLKSVAEKTLTEIHKEKRGSQIEILLKNIFGTTAISRTQNYTAKENLNFTKKNLSGYDQVDPINFLKAFYLDFYKSKVRQIVDLLLIQGQWTTNVQSQQFSDNFHHLMACADDVVRFDNDLAEDGPVGARIKRMYRSASPQDRMALNALQDQIAQVNNEARKIIQVSASNFISLGKMLKLLIEDYKKGDRGQIMINWRELDTRTDHHIGPQMTDVYKNLYYLVQLLQFYAKEAQ